MLVRQPKKSFIAFRKGAKVFIVLEGALILSTYMLYAACNRSQATRRYFYERRLLRPIVEFYYKTGQLCGNTTVRDYDQATWAALDNLAESSRNGSS